MKKNYSMSSTEYELLPAALKNEMILNSERNKNLKVGFYSNIYTFENNGITYKYRFHSIAKSNNKNQHNIIFNSTVLPHKNKVSDDGTIIFYDDVLKISLRLNNETFEEELTDMNLSPEQKLDLAEGKEITLNVSQLSLLNKQNGNNRLTSRTTKSFIADYSFFLGKSTLFLRENKVFKNGKLKTLNK